VIVALIEPLRARGSSAALLVPRLRVLSPEVGNWRSSRWASVHRLATSLAVRVRDSRKQGHGRRAVQLSQPSAADPRTVRYADRRHGGQRRAADGAPFILHLLEVASLLDRSGCPDEIVAAAVLHDTLEDTDISSLQLEAVFGAPVAELVAIVSDNPAIEHEEERKDEVRCAAYAVSAASFSRSR
jgi:hypothetical protein